MRLVDRKLNSPHYLAVFNGGHTLPPDAVALEAIEWMELQAMKSGRRTRDEALIDRLLAKRQRLIAETASPVEIVHQLDALASDFKSLRDVTAETNRSKELAKQPEVKKMLARERSDVDAEARLIGDVFDLEAGLGDDSRRRASLSALRDRLSKLSERAAATDDSPERRQARRVLRAITSGAGERSQDREYRALLEQYGLRGR
jgi:hypothetical protein